MKIIRKIRKSKDERSERHLRMLKMLEEFEGLPEACQVNKIMHRFEKLYESTNE